MSNERLRAAMTAAGLDIDAVAGHVDVDPKTVERWLRGRLPHRRHRMAVAGLLGEEEPYLWPKQRELDLEAGEAGTSAEIVAAWAHRASAPPELWRGLLERCSGHIDAIGYAMLFLPEQHPDLVEQVACQSCSYAYYRTSTKTTKRKIVYYRCIGSDGWRHEGGKICDNRPVRADQLEPLVWAHVSRLLTDPTLIAGELERRLAELRAANPATSQRGRLDRDLARASAGIARLLEAYQEQLVTLDDLRQRMPELRKREATIRSQLDALDA